MKIGVAALASLSVALSACGLTSNESATFRSAVNPVESSHFFHHVIDPQAPGGRDCCTDVLATGDINGDGYGDVLIGSEHADAAGLFWYEYPTWRRHEIGAGDFTTDGEIVDFDGDGDMDVVVGTSDAGVLWFENEHSGSRWRPHKVGTGYAHDVELADVNGDGRLDVILASKNSVELWTGREGGAFRQQILSNYAGEGLATVDLDSDGDVDILYSNIWIENRAKGNEIAWIPHTLAGDWPADTRTQFADMDADGRMDVVLSASEGPGRLSWFKARHDDPTKPWIEHPISRRRFVGIHSLAVADFDLDGRPDVAIAEMHTSLQRRVTVYFQRASKWQRRTLATHGSHNMRAADLDGDGDPDLVGKNYAGRDRIVEFWENRAADLQLVPPLTIATGDLVRWEYLPIDSSRPKTDANKFGLLVGDLNMDGSDDVISGGTLYVNPGELNNIVWPRESLGREMDAIHVGSAKNSRWRSIVAVDSDAIHMLTRQVSGPELWSSRKISSLPPGRTQGFAATGRGQDDSQDLFFTRGEALFQLHMPADGLGEFTLRQISTEVDEAGVAVGDVDADGDDDVVSVAKGGRQLVWLEADPRQSWKAHLFGGGLHWFDRVAIADINADGRLDVVYTEETRDWDFNARVGWLEAPVSPLSGRWKNHTVAVLRSINSLGVIDVDQDGRQDLVIGEHTDMWPGRVANDTFTGVMLNRGGGEWDVQPIMIGRRSNHMGAVIAHLDPGRLDVLSMGWEQSCCLMRWRLETKQTKKNGDMH